MEWSTVKIENDAKGRNSPYASIGFGKISLSAAACKLISDYEQYKYVELLQGERNNTPCVGIRFLRQRSENSLPVKRRTQKTSKGKTVDGADIANKATLEKLFGPAASAKKSERYNVTKDEDSDNILIIYQN